MSLIRMCSGVSHVSRGEYIPLIESILNSDQAKDIFSDYFSTPSHPAVKYRVDPLREILITAVSECLNHDNHTISSNAALILRDRDLLCNRACDLTEVVSELTEQLSERRIQPAQEAASAIGTFLSTRPNDSKLPQWDGSPPSPDASTVQDLDQHRFANDPIVKSGYLHEVNQDTVIEAIDALIENIDRKQYKRSADWRVAIASASAIGAIGYQRPDLVKSAVPVLIELIDEQDERQPYLIYALTSIGYSKPDLVPNGVKDKLKDFVQNAGHGAGWKNFSAARVGYRKIAHAPVHLEQAGTDPTTDLNKISEKLFRFMLGKHTAPYDEVIQAFVAIYSARPDELVVLLEQELDRILKGESRSIDFPSNFMGILEVLSRVNAKNLKPIIETSTAFYQDHSRHHSWYENALDFHRNVALENTDLLPPELESTVIEFLQSEQRHSIQSRGEQFLKTIEAWDEDKFEFAGSNDGLSALVEQIKDSEHEEFSNIVEEFSDDSS